MINPQGMAVSMYIFFDKPVYGRGDYSQSSPVDFQQRVDKLR
jgi:hypothetical protein